jgi:hypothetical protein
MTNDKQKDRLVELLNEAEYENIGYEMANKFYPFDNYKSRSEFVADHLLANGVIVPPCKVGDVVYEVDLPEYGIIVCKVTKVLYDSKEVIINVIDGHGKGSEYYFEFDDFSKTVFLTKEEAEAKLKEGVQG